MIQKAWSSIEEVPYCFARSSIECQGCTALKFVEFDPNWPFPDCNSSLNSPMAMKCCTKLETARERCPIVFQGHPSNFKVTRDKTSPILTQIVCFRTIGRLQLSNPSDLPRCSWGLNILIGISFEGLWNRYCHSQLQIAYIHENDGNIKHIIILQKTYLIPMISIGRLGSLTINH